MTVVRDADSGRLFNVSVLRRKSQHRVSSVDNIDKDPKLKCLGQSRAFQRNMFVDMNHKYSMCVPAKNSVSVMKKLWIAIYNDYWRGRMDRELQDAGIIHRAYSTFFKTIYKQQLKAQGIDRMADLFSTQSGINSFAVLRDPLTRVHSAFMEKCWLPSIKQASHICKEVIGRKAYAQIVGYRKRKQPRMAFATFVNGLKMSSVKNEHFVPQVTQCAFQCTKSMNDFYIIFNKETFYNSVRFVLSELQLRWDDQVIDNILARFTPHSKSISSQDEMRKLKRFYNSSLARDMLEYYLDDYEQLPIPFPINILKNL